MSVSVLGREGPAASLFSAQKSGLSAPGRGVHSFLGGSESVDTGIWGSPTEKAGSLPGAPVARRPSPHPSVCHAGPQSAASSLREMHMEKRRNPCAKLHDRTCVPAWPPLAGHGALPSEWQSSSLCSLSHLRELCWLSRE